MAESQQHRPTSKPDGSILKEKFSYLSSGERSQEGLSLGGGHLEGGDIDGDAGILGRNQGLVGTGVGGIRVESLNRRFKAYSLVLCSLISPLRAKSQGEHLS